MQINSAAIVGLGALGVMYGHHLSKTLPDGALHIVADDRRLEKYRTEGVRCNGEPCSFRYWTPEEAQPVDIVLVAVKQTGLAGAVDVMKNLVASHTVILSLLNGISSEQILADAFGEGKLLLCVAQGMDALREGRSVSYHNMGWVVFGDKTPGPPSENARRVAEFFDSTSVPHILADDMPHRLWSKFMLNCGVNQVVAVYGEGYADVQRPGRLRDMMLTAMREVMELAHKEGIALGEEDIAGWMSLLATLNPMGKPSMRQDVEAQRRSEVELFAGTVMRLGQKHGIPTPVNDELYRHISEIESDYFDGSL